MNRNNHLTLPQRPFMSRLFFPILVALIVNVFPTHIFSQKNLHLIQSFDNINQDILPGCQKDYDHTTEFFKDIAEYAGMEFQLHQLNFDKNSVFSFFQQFSCGSDDAVVFIYSGHGFLKEDDNVLWPFLYYCHADLSGSGSALATCGVPLDWIHHALIAINPRMSITIGNSCNTEFGQQESKNKHEGLDKKEQSTPDHNDLRNLELLTKFRGHILTSASLPGQFAYTNDEEGSYYINELIDVMNFGFRNSNQPTSWASILRKASNEVKEKKSDQKPQFLIVKNSEKMYSEGSGKYQNECTYAKLNISVPDVGGSNYEQVPVDDIATNEYNSTWETQYDIDEGVELALEELPILMLYTAWIDDENISNEEEDRTLNIYLKWMDELGYDQESAEENFDLSMEDLFDAVKKNDLEEFINVLTVDFKKYLNTDFRQKIIKSLPTLPDNPSHPNIKSYIRTLNN